MTKRDAKRMEKEIIYSYGVDFILKINASFYEKKTIKNKEAPNKNAENQKGKEIRYLKSKRPDFSAS